VGGLLSGPLRSATRSYPFLSGRANLLQREPFARLLPAEEVSLARLTDGGRLLVKGHDYIGRSILLTGDYDPKITWLCRNVLRPGDTMLDVGANMGVVSAYAARIVGSSGAVHAFEPQPELAALATRSMAINGFHHVVVHPIGLSDSERRLALYGSPSNLGSASLQAGDPADELIGTVQLKRAADVFESLQLGPIRMLKLDIEGHEESFFAGAGSYLAHNPPDVIAFESQGSEPFAGRPVVALLGDLGYDFFQVPKALLSMRLIHVAPGKTAAGFDFVAIRPGSRLAAVLTAHPRRGSLLRRRPR
jgi:FkbM family methyltransferase